MTPRTEIAVEIDRDCRLLLRPAAEWVDVEIHTAWLEDDELVVELGDPEAPARPLSVLKDEGLWGATTIRIARADLPTLLREMELLTQGKVPADFPPGVPAAIGGFTARIGFGIERHPAFALLRGHNEDGPAVFTLDYSNAMEPDPPPQDQVAAGHFRLSERQFAECCVAFRKIRDHEVVPAQEESSGA